MSETATINIGLPRGFDSLADADDRIAVEHAKLDCRMVEVVCALAIRDFLDGASVAIFVPTSARAKFLLSSWLQDAAVSTRKYTTQEGEAKFHSFSSGSASLWVCGGTRFLNEDLPFHSAARVYGIGCDEMRTDLRTLFPGTPTFFAGVMADRDHWFFGYCRQGDVPSTPVSSAEPQSGRNGTGRNGTVKPTQTVSMDPQSVDGDAISSTSVPLEIAEKVVLHRFDKDAVLRAFPDQKRLIPSATDPYYERHFLLKDVLPRYETQSFIVFTRSRCKVRTDKPLHLLSKAQQAEARDQHGTPVVTFDVSRLQKRYLAQKRLAVMKGKRPWYLLLKYRRGGFTTIEQAQSYMVAVTRPRSAVATLAHTGQSTSRIFRIALLYHERDPKAPKRISDSKTVLEFQNGSQFFVGTAGGHGFARGDTLQRVHGSEVSKWMRSKRATASMEDVEDLSAGLLGAASNGEVVFETTPNGREWFCIQYEESKLGLNEFTPIFLRWFDDPMNRMAPGTFDPQEIMDTFSPEELALIAKHNLDLAQIAFRRQAKKVYKRLFPQEMPEDDKTCFLASGVCFFDTDVILSMLEIMPEQKSEGKWRTLRGGYEVRWKEPEEGRSYVAGCDTSEGLPGCDLNGVGILDKESGEQVASIHGLFNPRVLAGQAVRICRDYNDALLGIERENHGHAVLQRVVELGYRKPHFRGGPLFYFDKRQDVRKSRPGWTTNGETRPVMLEDLAEAVEQRWMKVHDQDFLGECLSFRLQSNGKFEADSGAHDDTVMKWAIAWQMRKYKRPKPRIALVNG